MHETDALPTSLRKHSSKLWILFDNNVSVYQYWYIICNKCTKLVKDVQVKGETCRVGKVYGNSKLF